MNKKLTIICCIYNELNILKKNLFLIEKQFLKDPFFHEVIIIDNNSDDGSKKFLIDFKKKIKVRKLILFLIKKILVRVAQLKMELKTHQEMLL